MPEIVQEIGAYAGLAAVVGLAVLSALYFSQARDVKRLREWAGRAPERTAEGVAAPQVAQRVVAQPQPKPATAQGAAKPGTSPVPERPAPAQAAAAGATPAVAKAATPGKPAAATPAAQKAGAGAPANAGGGKAADAPGVPVPAGAEAKDTEKDEAQPPVPVTAGAPAEAEGEAEDGAAAPTAQAGTAAPPKPGDTAAPGAPVPPKPGVGGPPTTPAGRPPPRGPGTPATPAARRLPDPAPLAGAGTGARGPRFPSRRPEPSPSETAILPPHARPDQAWHKRLLASPRYLVLAVAGVLIIGGGAAFGLSQLGREEAPPPQTGESERFPAESDAKQTRGAPAIDPSKVTVSVLNGTTVPGLAAQIGDKIEGFGFVLGNVTNNSDQTRNESVVLFAPGGDREAAVVGKRLGISQREPIDAQSQALGGDARVVVIAGADQTQ